MTSLPQSSGGIPLQVYRDLRTANNLRGDAFSWVEQARWVEDAGATAAASALRDAAACARLHADSIERACRRAFRDAGVDFPENPPLVRQHP